MVGLRNQLQALVAIGTLTLSLASPVFAQGQSASISLQDAFDLANTQNPQHKARLIAARLEGARLQEQSARFDSSLFSAFRYEKGASSTQGTQNMLATGFSRGSLEVGARKPLPWGGSVELSVGAVRSRNAIALPSPTGPSEVNVREYFVRPRVTLRQPILNGAGLDAAKAPIKRARAQVARAKSEVSLQGQQLLRDVALAYWDLKGAQLSLQACSKAKLLVVQQIETTRVLIEEGRRAPRDLLALEQELSVKDIELEEAKSQQYNRSTDLRVLMGVPIQGGDGPVFEAVEPLQQPCGFGIPDSSSLDELLDGNAELAALSASVESVRQDLVMAKNQQKPTLDAYLSAGTRGLSRDAIAQQNLQSGSWKKAMGSFFDSSAPPRLVDYSLEAGLEFSWAPRNRQARARALQARLAVDAALLELKTRRQGLAAQIRKRANEAQSLALRWTMANKSVKLASENLQVERERFAAGFGTNDDLLLRIQELYLAQRRLGEIQVSWLKSRARFFALVGPADPRTIVSATCDS